MSEVVHILHDDSAHQEPHEPGASAARKPVLRNTRFALIAASAAALFLIVFGLMLWRAAQVPDDTRVQAKLERVKREIAARRSARDRTATAAGLADRIVQAQSGRRAQRQWLEEDADTQ